MQFILNEIHESHDNVKYTLIEEVLKREDVINNIHKTHKKRLPLNFELCSFGVYSQFCCCFLCFIDAIIVSFSSIYGLLIVRLVFHCNIAINFVF